MAGGKFNKGYYSVINKERYIGVKAPFFRSNWEKRVMYYLDIHPDVIKWDSESIIIPYLWTDGKIHKYYTDFYAEVKNKAGIVEKLVIEVKPLDQCPDSKKIPKPPKRKTAKSIKNYQDKMIALKRNQLKWESARAFCKKNGLKFQVITEKEIFREK